MCRYLYSIGASCLRLCCISFRLNGDIEVSDRSPSLRLHALRGKFAGLHSVSINLSYRLTLELLIQDQQIIPVNVGGHDAVY